MTEAPARDILRDPATLHSWRNQVHEVNRANGWFEDDRSLGDGHSLIHSEIAEMLEAYREWGLEDATGRDCPCTPESMQVSTEHLCKPEGVGSEAADILIRLLDEAYRQNVHLGPGVTYYRTSPMTIGEATSRLHVQTARWYSDVRSRQHMDAPKEIIDGAMEHGLIAIYSELVYVCDCLGIDLVAEYHRKIAYNKTRGHKHGGKRL